MNIKLLITCYEGNYKKIINRIDKKKYPMEIILYNKKNDKFGIPVKNIGVDTYDKLHFIVNNYENLPDIIIFTTDNALVEPKKIKKLEFILNNINILKKKSGFLTGHIFKIPEESVKFTLDVYPRTGKKVIPSTIRPYDKWFNEYIDKDIKVEETYMCMKSIFAVTKDLILSNSKDYYNQLIDQIEKHSVIGPDSEIPHYLERSWLQIFTKNDTKLMFHDSKTYKNIP